MHKRIGTVQHMENNQKAKANDRTHKRNSKKASASWVKSG